MLRRWMLLTLLASACTPTERALLAEAPGSTAWEGSPGPGRITSTIERGCADQEVLQIDHTAVLRTDKAGATRELFRVGAARGLSSDEVLVHQWDLRGRFIALIGFLSSRSAEGSHEYEYALLDLEGGLLFHQIRAEPYNPRLFLSEDGTLTISGQASFVRHPDGRIEALDGFQPMGAPQGNTVLASKGAYWRAGSPIGWLELGSLSFRALEHAPRSSPPQIEARGSRGIYPTEAEATLAIATPTGSRLVSHPALAGGFSIQPGDSDRFFLLFGSDSATFRLDVETATLEPLAPLFDPKNVWLDRSQVAADGAILRNSKTDEILQLQRSTDLGVTWSAVGNPVAPPAQESYLGWQRSLSAITQGRHTLIQHLEHGYGDFLIGVQLTTNGQTVLDVNTNPIYLEGPKGDLGRPVLSSDGSCAALWVSHSDEPIFDGPVAELVLLDAVSANRRTVLSGSRASALRLVASEP